MRRVLRRARPIGIRLQLNPAAQSLLKKRHKLAVKLQLAFTRKGGKRVTASRIVTITPPPHRRTRCHIAKPVRPNPLKPVKLPACLLGKKK